MTLTLMTAFSRFFLATFNAYFPVLLCFAAIKFDRTIESIIYQLLTHYFPTFYRKKLAFCLEFLYLCTGNRKNSLLVPKVGHL